MPPRPVLVALLGASPIRALPFCPFPQVARESRPLRAYRDTIAFVNELPPDNGVAGQRTEVRQGAVAGVLGKPLPIAGVQVGSAIPVSADCSMTIIANGVVTQEGLERLKQYIDLIKTWFPSQSHNHPAPVPSSSDGNVQESVPG